VKGCVYNEEFWLPNAIQTWLEGRPRYGMVWYGMVWYGMVWYGMVWYGIVWYGMVWYGMVWYGMVWYGMIWYGMDAMCLPKFSSYRRRNIPFGSHLTS